VLKVPLNSSQPLDLLTLWQITCVTFKIG